MEYSQSFIETVFFKEDKITFIDDILTLSFLGWRKKGRIWHSMGGR